MTTNYYYKNSKSKFLEISGPDAFHYIQNLITNDINKCKENNYLYSCLLTPQGKFSADFFIFKSNDNYIFEIHEIFYENFYKKLSIYKLRSNITIEQNSRLYSFIIFSNNKINTNYEIYNVDPRNTNIGKKLIQKNSDLDFNNDITEINEDQYHQILIKNKIPYSPKDLKENQSLLLENNFDNINAISWDKGCYVGQEITARMKYRALLKKQIYNLKIISGEIEIGDEIIFNEVSIGKVVSKINKYIFCMLKIELIKEQSKNKEEIEINKSIRLKFL
tara:strand:- start:249 stop:1079 length:831 start_codon:yes stop_codon:yes gene_type:complete